MDRMGHLLVHTWLHCFFRRHLILPRRGRERSRAVHACQVVPVSSSQTPKLPDSQTPKLQTPKLPNSNFPNSQTPTLPHSEIPNSQTPKLPNAKRPKLPNSRLPDSQTPSSQTPKLTNSQTPQRRRRVPYSQTPNSFNSTPKLQTPNSFNLTWPRAPRRLAWPPGRNGGKVGPSSRFRQQRLRGPQGLRGSLTRRRQGLPGVPHLLQAELHVGRQLHRFVVA